eukprot:4654002-Amphidinium_carterae.1
MPTQSSVAEALSCHGETFNCQLSWTCSAAVCKGQSWLSSSLKVKNLGYVGDSPAAGSPKSSSKEDSVLLKALHASLVAGQPVQDISSVAVSSLKGTRYLDKAAADGEPDDAVEETLILESHNHYGKVGSPSFHPKSSTVQLKSLAESQISVSDVGEAYLDISLPATVQVRTGKQWTLLGGLTEFFLRVRTSFAERIQLVVDCMIAHICSRSL